MQIDTLSIALLFDEGEDEDEDEAMVGEVVKVGVTVDACALVGIRPISGYRRSEKVRSVKSRRERERERENYEL